MCIFLAVASDFLCVVCDSFCSVKKWLRVVKSQTHFSLHPRWSETVIVAHRNGSIEVANAALYAWTPIRFFREYRIFFSTKIVAVWRTVEIKCQLPAKHGAWWCSHSFNTSNTEQNGGNCADDINWIHSLERGCMYFGWNPNPVFTSFAADVVNEANVIVKMYLENRQQPMLQLHLSEQQFYCPLRCALYQRLDGTTDLIHFAKDTSLALGRSCDCPIGSNIWYEYAEIMISSKQKLVHKLYQIGAEVCSVGYI